MSKKWLTQQFDTRLEEVKLEEANAALPNGVIMRFKGKFGHAGRITENGRLYPRKVMSRELERIVPKLVEKAVIGETDHPDPTRGGPSVRQSAFIITGLRMGEQGEIFGEADVVDTSAGRDLANLIRAGAQVGMSSRGRGTHKPARMTSSHPEFEQNQTWKDKEFDEVNEDFSLRTFDAVIGQAVEDAYVDDYREQQTTQEGKKMDLEQLKKLLAENADLRKQIMTHIFESDDGKAVVKTIVETAVKENSDKMQKEIKSMVNSYLISDEFSEQFSKNDDLTEVKCPKCGAMNPDGAEKCEKCGAVIEEGEPEESTKDGAAVTELKKLLSSQEESNKKLLQRVDEMEKANRLKEESVVVTKTIEDMLAGKPNLLAESVREDLKSLTLTPENAKVLVEQKIARLEAFAKATGANLTEATGVGRSRPSDSDNSSASKEPTRDVQILDNLR